MRALFLENRADMPLGETIFPGQLAEIGAIKFPQDGLAAQIPLQGRALGKVQKLAAGGVDDFQEPFPSHQFIEPIKILRDLGGTEFELCHNASFPVRFYGQNLSYDVFIPQIADRCWVVFLLSG